MRAVSDKFLSLAECGTNRAGGFPLGRQHQEHLSTAMNAAAHRFLDDMRADPRFADHADWAQRGLEAIYDESCDNSDALGLEWILKQPRNLEEKIVAQIKLLTFVETNKGEHRIDMKRFLGW
jgi:hypothetical protein